MPLTTHDQNTPNNINIGEVLREVVNSRTQPQDNDTGLSNEADDGDFPIRNGTKQNPIIQEPTAEGSRMGEAEKSTAAKPANQKVKSKDFEDGDQRESLGKQKAKNKAKDDSRDESAQGHSTKKTTSNDRQKGTRFKGQDGDDLEEDSSTKGSRTNNAARSKSMNRPSQVDDDEENNENTPVRDPVAPKKPAGKKAGKRSESIPVSPAQSSISGFTFTNSGQGTMTNENVGNVYNSSISGVGNDYSVNHYRPGARRKRTYA
ncbi:hypothetical protein BYT27DRAFT_6680980 [Phlegmacium glaucopus]|nr:hypothetical protein BYT27DRAFT_6680980 [Phlegmacium glaucopus]